MLFALVTVVVEKANVVACKNDLARSLGRADLLAGKRIFEFGKKAVRSHQNFTLA